jgi:hypothetical protein
MRRTLSIAQQRDPWIACDDERKRKRKKRKKERERERERERGRKDEEEEVGEEGERRE